MRLLIHRSTATSIRRLLLALAAGWGAAGGAAAARGQLTDASAVTAEVRPQQGIVMIGQPAWVDFFLHNPTDQVTVLYVPGAAELDLNPPEMGLPPAHVYGGEADPPWLTLAVTGGEAQACQAGDRQAGSSIALRLAPQATVGVRLDVAKAFPALRHPGSFTLSWAPYGGAVQAPPVQLEVRSFKQARIETDFGTMTLRLLYDKAPRHAENFVELAASRFYDGLTFHRLAPGYLIQGGSPGGKPAGIHPDGRLLAPEFSDYPFGPGTVGMARRPGDPHSASCQFFISAARLPELDGEYSAFAQLVGEESFATLQKLMEHEVDEDSRPRRQLYIRRIRIQDAPPPLPPAD